MINTVIKRDGTEEAFSHEKSNKLAKWTSAVVTDQESNVETVQNILDRIDNPLGTVTDDMQGYLESEKTFYIALMNNLQK